MTSRTSTAIAARSVIAAAAAMQASGVTLRAASQPDLTDALSGIFGSVSLTSWICLLLPQLIQNYKSQSAEGLSMAFLFVWLLGDVTNLTGALLTGLAPTAMALACYFCISDLVLISQSLYYNALTARRNRQHAAHHARRRSSSTAVVDNSRVGRDDTPAAASDEAVADDEGEEGPLLAHQRSSSMGLPGSHRRPSVHHAESNLDPIRRIITGEDETVDSNPWLHNALSLLAVWAVGTAGYFASYRMGAWDAPAGDVPDLPVGDDVIPLIASEGLYTSIGLGMGYVSAVCYLCARIPQIIKNYREKSCEGLALLFFLLSLTGNFTYGASLIAYSQDREYLLKALPWLMGSLGTIVEDMIIFVQFRIYSPKRGDTKPVADEDVGPVGTYGAA